MSAALEDDVEAASTHSEHPVIKMLRWPRHEKNDLYLLDRVSNDVYREVLLILSSNLRHSMAHVVAESGLSVVFGLFFPSVQRLVLLRPVVRAECFSLLETVHVLGSLEVRDGSSELK